MPIEESPVPGTQPEQNPIDAFRQYGQENQPSIPLTREEKLASEQAQRAFRPSPYETFGFAALTESTVGNIDTGMQRAMIVPEYGFQLTRQLVDQLTDGIDEQFWPQFSKAQSEREAWIIRDHLLDRQFAEQKLAAAGWSGTAARMYVNTVGDPVNFAIGAATGGYATTLKGGSLVRMAKMGLIAAGEVTAINAIRAEQDPTMTKGDMAVNALFAFGVGGVFGAFTKEHPELSAKLNSVAREDVLKMQAAQAVDNGYRITPEGESVLRVRMNEAWPEVQARKAWSKVYGYDGDDFLLPSDLEPLPGKTSAILTHEEPYWTPPNRTLADDLLEPVAPLPKVEPWVPESELTPKQLQQMEQFDLFDLGPQNKVANAGDAADLPGLPSAPTAEPSTVEGTKLILTAKQRAEYEKARATKAPKPEAPTVPAEEKELFLRNLSAKEAARQDLVRTAAQIEVGMKPKWTGAEPELAAMLERAGLPAQKIAAMLPEDRLRLMDTADIAGALEKGGGVDAVVARLNSIGDAAKKRLDAKLRGRLLMGVPVDALPDLVQYGTAMMAAEGLTFAEFSVRMTARFGAKFGKDLQDELPSLYDLAGSAARSAAARSAVPLSNVADQIKKASGGETVLKHSGPVNKAVNWALSKTSMGGGLENSPSATVRKIGRAMMGVNYPTVEGDPASLGGLSFLRIANGRWNNFVENDIAPLVRAAKVRGNRAMDAFMSEVRLGQIGGKVEDINAAKAAGLYRKAVADKLDEAAIAGVKGAKDVRSNPHWLPRVPLFSKTHNTVALVGKQNADDFFTTAIARKHPDMAKKDLAVLGKAYVDHAMQRGWGPDAPMHPAFKLDATVHWRELLEQAGVDETDINRMIGQMVKRDETGVIRNFRDRIDMDETYTMPVKLKDGSTYNLSLADFVETNADLLNRGFARSVNGAIAEQKLLELMALPGEKSAPSWGAAMQRLRNEASATLPVNELGKFKRDMESLDMLHKAIAGEPIENLKGWKRTWLNLVMKQNGLRLGGMFGMAQLPEYGSIMGEATYVSMVAKCDALAEIAEQTAKGELKHQTAREMQALTGAGDESLARYGSRQQEVGNDVITTRAGQLEDVMDKAGEFQRKYMSAVTPIDSHQRLGAATIGAMNLTEAAFSKTPVPPRRLLLMGMTEETWGKVKAQLLTHSTEQVGEHGIKYRSPNFAAWTDKDLAANALIGIHRWANDVIQTNDLASLSGWMTHGMGKLLLQFRNYPIAAGRQQFQRGLYLRDPGTFTAWSYQLGIGALVVMGLARARSIGMPKEEREKYLKEALTPRSIGAGAFQRASWTAMAPSVVDTIRTSLSFDPMFRWRTSGLDTNIITGSPTYDLLFRKTPGAIRSVTGPIVNPDYKFSQADWRNDAGLVWFNNVMGIQQGLNAIGTSLNLPKKSLPAYKPPE